MFFDMPHFHHLLARKIHQYRNQQCSLVNWLKQSQRMWHTYRTAYLEKNGLDWEIPYVFYRVFSSFFDFCARWLDAVEVLTSDQCALTEINDEALLETVEYSYLLGSYLHRSFWPRIDKVKHFISLNDVNPIIELVRETKKIRRNAANFRWLHDTTDDIEPHHGNLSLSERLANIGHSRVSIPPTLDSTAFEHYFPAMQDKVITFLDKLWLKAALRTTKTKPSLRQRWERLLRLQVLRLRHHFD